jgi:Negative regulator of beta-lactamase expression
LADAIPNVLWMPNNNFFANRDGLRARYVILHGTAGGASAQNIAAYFASTQGTANPVSSHYVIGQDGTVVQCVSDLNGAWANGVYSTGHAAFWDTTVNPNNITVSIEHVKSATDNSNQLSPAQQTASFQLINAICDRWQIPKTVASASGGITGHFSLDPVNRSNCPGPYPWDALWSYLGSQGEQMVISIDDAVVKNFFVAAPSSRWLCPRTGKRIGGAILNFYCQFGGDAYCGLTYLGLPLTDEVAITAHLGTVYQRFERGILAYDPNHVIDAPPGSGPVYCMHLDAVLPAAKSL